MTLAEGCDHFGIDASYYEGTATCAFYICDGSCYYEGNRDGTFFVRFDRDEYTGTEIEIARRLYVDWYSSECADEYTTEQLADLLQQFAIVYGLELASADEMLFDLTKEPPERRASTQHRAVAWLEWFCDTWEDTQRREDNAAFGNRA